MRGLVSAACLFLCSCGDPYRDAQTADTIEAWEAFLTNNPESAYLSAARTRLEELYLEKANASGAIEDFDLYFQKFPEGSQKKKAREDYCEALFRWADMQVTTEGWQKFLDDCSKDGKKLLGSARRRQKVAEHKDAFELGVLAMEMVNMAEDPDGPLNGYGFWVDVTATGDKPIEMLYLQLEYLDENGKPLGRAEWPVVAKQLPGNLPFEEGWDTPIKPGESRRWEWTASDLPTGWARRARVSAVDIKLVGE